MTIKIIGKDTIATVTLDKLNPGQVFYDGDGDLCIKTDESERGNIMVVMLERGVVLNYGPSLEVRPVTLECTVGG